MAESNGHGFIDQIELVYRELHNSRDFADQNKNRTVSFGLLAVAVFLPTVLVVPELSTYIQTLIPMLRIAAVGFALNAAISAAAWSVYSDRAEILGRKVREMEDTTIEFRP